MAMPCYRTSSPVAAQAIQVREGTTRAVEPVGPSRPGGICGWPAIRATGVHLKEKLKFWSHLIRASPHSARDVGRFLSWRRRDAALAVATFVVIIAPLLVIALPYRVGLYCHAAVNLIATGVLVAISVTAPGWYGRVKSAPRTLRAGVLCYSAAAVHGTAVALVRGNEVALLSGQLLSMALIPAAAFAGFALPARHRPLTWGLVFGVTVGGMAQIVWWAWSLLGGQLVDRLALPNSVSFAGPALLALLLALGHTSAGERHRLMAFLAAALTATIIVGSAIRGLWLVTVPTLMLYIVLWNGVRWVIWRRLLVAATIATGVVLGGDAALEHFLSTPRPSLFPDSPAATLGAGTRVSGEPHQPAVADARGGVTLLLPHPERKPHSSAMFPVPRGGGYLLRARVQGRGTGHAILSGGWYARDGSRVEFRASIPADDEYHLVRRIEVAPEGTEAVMVWWGSTRGSAGEWHISELSLSRLGGPAVALALKQRWMWRDRFASLVSIASGGDPQQYPAIAFRWTEAARVTDAFRTASWTDRLVGEGLGATVHLGVHGFDSRGQWVWYGDTNYIHNFYLFLLYKLGIVGTLLVLSALVLWAGWTLRRALGTDDREARAFLAAAASAWIGYCVWSLTSPEILDFRMAPLWGLLIAATAERAGAARRGTMER